MKQRDARRALEFGHDSATEMTTVNMVPETTLRSRQSVGRSLPLPSNRSICQRALALALVFVIITSTAFMSQGFPFYIRFGSLRCSQAKRTDLCDDFKVTASAPSTHTNLKEESDPLKLNAAVVHYCGGEQYANISKLSHENVKRYVARHRLELYVANSTTFPTEAFLNPKAWLKLAFILLTECLNDEHCSRTRLHSNIETSSR